MHEMNLDKYLERKKIKQADLARMIRTSPANVNKWAQKDGVPGYELCARLLEAGMTTEELFNVSVQVETETDDLEARVNEILAKALQKP